MQRFDVTGVYQTTRLEVSNLLSIHIETSDPATNERFSFEIPDEYKTHLREGSSIKAGRGQVVEFRQVWGEANKVKIEDLDTSKKYSAITDHDLDLGDKRLFLQLKKGLIRSSLYYVSDEWIRTTSTDSSTSTTERSQSETQSSNEANTDNTDTELYQSDSTDTDIYNSGEQ
ncbi:hypothetical protein [Haloferax gibbonsii]|uniref:hypothetical protein n=1 Tax=Haloferax gibbonsii TaxID=35746 RepID=UPI001268BDC2|nr:hypothetical protein [Haloferax gibbonsii]